MKPTRTFLLYRVGFVLAQLLGVLGNPLPAEGQAPVKVTSVVGAVGRHWLVEVKVVEVNGGDLGANHSSGLLNNAS